MFLSHTVRNAADRTAIPISMTGGSEDLAAYGKGEAMPGWTVRIFPADKFLKGW